MVEVDVVSTEPYHISSIFISIQAKARPIQTRLWTRVLQAHTIKGTPVGIATQEDNPLDSCSQLYVSAGSKYIFRD